MGDFSWKPARKKYGVVIHSFQAESIRASIPLQIGETVHIWEEYCSGNHTDRSAKWYRGYSMSNRSKKGIFPASYVHLKDCLVDNEGVLVDLKDDLDISRDTKWPYESITAIEDPVIKEVTFVLKEWNVAWKKLFVIHAELFKPIWNVMLELIKIRSKLVANTLTHDQSQELKNEIISLIDSGNGKLGMDRVPRVNGEQVDADKLSAVKLYRVHKESAEGSQNRWQGLSVRHRPRSENKASPITHLMVSFKHFVTVNIGEESETFLSLFDAGKNAFISERFIVRYTKLGMPNDMSKLDSNIALFTELSESDIKKDLYLVAHIHRHADTVSSGTDMKPPGLKGRVLVETNKKSPIFKYRRPWGVAVLSLKDFMNIKPEEELDFTLKITRTDDNESLHSHMHENLIKRQIQMQIYGKGQTDKQNIAFTVGLKLLYGELASVKAEHPTVFKKSTIVQQMDFSDIISPGEIRNDLYITLVSGYFDRGSKSAAKNLEIKLTVFDSDNKEISDCISGWCGEPLTTHYFSTVYYHSNNPKWNEIIRLSIPVEKFIGAHIRLELCHCSTRDRSEKKLYGFSFINVTSQNNITQHDGTHVLNVYKCDDIHKLKGYKHLPTFQDDFNDPAMISSLPTNIPFQRTAKENITIFTFLCSTKFTQKLDLLAILQWTPSQKNTEQCLHNLINLRGQEVIKYLQDLLDSLFNMFEDQNGDRVPFALEVFHALVHIFNLLEETMFENFNCIVEKYLENFSYPLVHRELMYCLIYKTEIAARSEDLDNEFKIEQVFMVLEDIFKFTVKSCKLFQGDWTETLQLKKVFECFSKILCSTDDALRETQIMLLSQVPKIYTSLLELVSKPRLTNLLITLCVHIPKNLHPTLFEARMNLAKSNVNSDLFTDPESRKIILQLCLSMIKKCMIMKKSLRVTVETLADILDIYANLKQTEDVNKELNEIIMAMFDIITKTLLTLEEPMRKSIGGMLTSCLMELLHLMDDEHYNKLISSYPKGRPLKEFLMCVLLVFHDIIKRDAFPSDWRTMRLVSNHIILTAIQYIAQSLTQNFLTGDNFEEELWIHYFDLAVAFVTQPSLQLEHYSEAKRDSVKDSYQDMRVLIGLQIQTLWNGLGDHKRHFIPSMIGPFLEVTLVPERDLRKATLPIFFDMMICQQQQDGNFILVENEFIEKLDDLVTNHHGDYEYMSLFQSILLDKVQTEPTLREDGKRFVVSVTSLLDKLLDYRQVVEGEDNEDKKMHCTFNILNFYKDNINREELYVRYINKLFQLHHEANNFIEAGLTLQLYAQLLQWNDEELSADLGYHKQKQWERKEELYLRIIDCFDRGKAWEYGIPLCKELAEVYEKKFFYLKLSEILQRQAKFFTNILNSLTQRQKPSYFRVVYYGKSFPPFIRNKSFIYRGDELMKLGTVKQNLLTEYPSATIHGNKPVDKSIREGDAQYIQLCAVTPIPNPRSEFLGIDVPSEVQMFYNYNEVDTFQFDRPYHQGERDQNNDFKTLWLERTIMKTTYKLPGILRWYEIIETEVLQLTPLSTAIINMCTVNNELQHLVTHCKEHEQVFFKQMEMRLQGVISAAVNGGIPKYQEAFFCKEFREKHPEESEKVIEFQKELMKQMELLGQGLQIHGELASEDLQPLHISLVDLFKTMKKDISHMHLRTSVSDTPPRPGTPGSSSQHSSGGSSSRSSIISADAIYQDDDSIYMDPDARASDPDLPPPPPEKQRPGSLWSNLRLRTHNTAPPIPSRPISCLISDETIHQFNNGLQNSRSSTASETALNNMPLSSKVSGLSASVSSSHIESQMFNQHLNRFSSTPNAAAGNTPSKGLAPPPLPNRRKNSDTNRLMACPPAPALPKHTEPVPQVLLQQNDPAFSSQCNLIDLENKPKHRASSFSDKTVADSGLSENREPPTPAHSTEHPPLPPRRNSPALPPMPSSKFLSKTVHASNLDACTPPPIPRRTSVATPGPRSPTSPDNTKL